MGQFVQLQDGSHAMQTTLTGSNATKAVAVTPNDTTVISATKGLYVGATGNITVTMANGADVTFNALIAGQIHPISVTKVKATGTTATGIVAVY